MGLHLNLALACAFAIQIRRHRPRKDDAHDAQQKNDGEYSGDDVDLRAHGRHRHHLAHPPGSNARRHEDDIFLPSTTPTVKAGSPRETIAWTRATSIARVRAYSAASENAARSVCARDACRKSS